MTFDSLEPKRLLAVSLAFDTDAGVLTLYGSSENDAVYVTQVDSDQTKVQYNGNQSMTYATNTINEIVFWGGAGDDFFQNDTAIKSLFGGHTGNDTFYGSSAADRVYAGDGNDILFGRGGDDVLEGGNGNDQLDGGSGNDFLSGWFGDDVINGGSGNDTVNAAWGDDIISAGDGNDYVLGGDGNDIIRGGAGDDYLYGQAANDQVWGDAGRDRVRGNLGDDVLFGGTGNDYMMVDNGTDRAYGEEGQDEMFGWIGSDLLDGGPGDDLISGLHGNDELIGGEGDDVIIGGDGDDLIFGDQGNDSIYGQNGNDRLFGGADLDSLFGGSGDDSLYGGGLNDADQLIGNSGEDRYLFQAGDVIVDRLPEDAVVNFIDEDSVWTDKEIEVLAGAFDKLYQATGNNLLIKDSLPSGDLKLHKHASLGGAAGINSLQSSWSSDGTTVTYNYERKIQILDWDETSQWYNDQYVSVAIHEIGHNWDNGFELIAANESLSGKWEQFLALSGWTETNPNDASNYTQSQNGRWWYHNTALFAENYGRTSPYEDMATTFETYFENLETPENISTDMKAKTDLLGTIFQTLANQA